MINNLATVALSACFAFDMRQIQLVEMVAAGNIWMAKLGCVQPVPSERGSAPLKPRLFALRARTEAGFVFLAAC